MPTLRAFRALRYAHLDPLDLSDVVCPPYDIIAPSRQEALLARDPHNAVRLELPQAALGEADETRYRSAARTLAAWRTERVLVKDRAATVTVHEMRFRGRRGEPRRARGVFARVRLEPFDAGGGVRRHERTMAGPKEDRYQLLRATGTNLSPVVMLHEADPAATGTLLDRLTDRPADAWATTDDGVDHRLWIIPASSGIDQEDGSGPASTAGPEAADADRLLALIGACPLTIADGHHRYETALRYQAERGQNRACESDPAWDYVLALVYGSTEAPSVLPTHRVVLRGPSGEALLAALSGLAEVERLADPGEVLARMVEPEPVHAADATGSGRVGLVSGPVAAILRLASAVDPVGAEARSAASLGLDVNRLAGVLERLGVDAAALVAGDRLAYVKSATEAVAMVTDGDAAAALLIDGPPVSAVTRIAAAGEVMPPKSTYFEPKAPTGLLFGPLEW